MRLDHLEVTYEQESASEQLLQAWDQTGLHIFWNDSRKMESIFLNEVEHASFAILHEDYYASINQDSFKTIVPYFRLVHSCEIKNEYVLGDQYSIVAVDTKTELEKVSNLIGKCYKDIHPSADAVRKWTETDVFDESLWIWIVHHETQTPVALGIADLDKSVTEGSLEWIQVLPGYQGKGLGKALVLELLNRMHGKVEFVTVSGEVNNQTNPERLYKSCGFTGNDVWWLLRK